MPHQTAASVETADADYDKSVIHPDHDGSPLPCVTCGVLTDIGWPLDMGDYECCLDADGDYSRHCIAICTDHVPGGPA